MSYDDLAFSGVQRRGTSAAFCEECKEEVDLARCTVLDDSARPCCPYCGNAVQVSRAPNRQPTEEKKGGGTVDPFLLSLFHGMMNGGGGGGGGGDMFGGPTGVLGDLPQNTYQQMVRAQQGVDVEELIAQMLSNSSHKSPPTSKDFLDKLPRVHLAAIDFLQAVVEVDTDKRPFLCTVAKFGADVTGKHDAARQSHCHVSCHPVRSMPVEGHGNLENADAFKGKIVVMQRGKISFVDKAKVAQKHGAAALLVIQTEDVWPYTMTDNANTGGDVAIPVVMVSKADGERLQAWLAAQQQDANSKLHIVTRNRPLACPVCRDDFDPKTEVISLPCIHHFHPDCILPWLKERNTCPLCRHALPAGVPSDKQAAQQTQHNLEQLQRSMYT